jgi:hypothetical protein
MRVSSLLCVLGLVLAAVAGVRASTSEHLSPSLEGHLDLAELGSMPPLPPLGHHFDDAEFDASLLETEQSALPAAPVAAADEELLASEENGINLMEIHAGATELMSKLPPLPKHLAHLELDPELDLEEHASSLDDAVVAVEIAAASAPIPAPVAAAAPVAKAEAEADAEMDPDAAEISAADHLLAETEELAMIELYNSLGFGDALMGDSETESDADSETETEADADADSDAEAEADSESESESDSEAESESETHSAAETDADAESENPSDWYASMVETGEKRVSRFDAQDILEAAADAKRARLRLSKGIPVFKARILDPMSRPEIKQLYGSFYKIQHNWSKLPVSWNPKIKEETAEDRWNRKYPEPK